MTQERQKQHFMAFAQASATLPDYRPFLVARLAQSVLTRALQASAPPERGRDAASGFLQRHRLGLATCSQEFQRGLVSSEAIKGSIEQVVEKAQTAQLSAQALREAITKLIDALQQRVQRQITARRQKLQEGVLRLLVETIRGPLEDRLCLAEASAIAQGIEHLAHEQAGQAESAAVDQESNLQEAGQRIDDEIQGQAPQGLHLLDQLRRKRASGLTTRSRGSRRPGKASASSGPAASATGRRNSPRPSFVGPRSIRDGRHTLRA